MTKKPHPYATYNEYAAAIDTRKALLLRLGIMSVLSEQDTMLLQEISNRIIATKLENFTTKTN